MVVVNVELDGVEVRLRAKNQLTLPEAIVAALGARPGDRIRMTATSSGTATLRLLRRSYAGALVGLWGATDADVASHLEAERQAWDR